MKKKWKVLKATEKAAIIGTIIASIPACVLVRYLALHMTKPAANEVADQYAFILCLVFLILSAGAAVGGWSYNWIASKRKSETKLQD